MIEILESIAGRLETDDALAMRLAELDRVGQEANPLARYCIGMYGPGVVDQYKRLKRTMSVFDNEPEVIVWPQVRKLEFNRSVNDSMFKDDYPDFDSTKPMKRIHHSHNAIIMIRPKNVRFRLAESRSADHNLNGFHGFSSIDPVVYSEGSNLYKSEYFYTNESGHKRTVHTQQAGYRLDYIEMFLDKYHSVPTLANATKGSVALFDQVVDEEAVARKRLHRNVWMQDRQPFILDGMPIKEFVYDQNFHFAFVSAAHKIVNGLVVAVANRDIAKAKDLNQQYRLGVSNEDFINPYEITNEMWPVHTKRFYDIIKNNAAYLHLNSTIAWLFASQYRADEAVAGRKVLY